MQKIFNTLKELQLAFGVHGNRDLNEIPVDATLSKLNEALKEVAGWNKLMDRITSFLEGFEDDEVQGGLPEGLMVQIRHYTDKKWAVRNMTDGGIPVTHELVTRKEAEEIVKNFPERYRHQTSPEFPNGYYSNNRRQRMDPKDVVLEILDVDEIDQNITFMWIDKTGRGFKEKISLQAIIDGEDDSNYDGQWLHTWARNAEVGDQWESRTAQFTRID